MADFGDDGVGGAADDRVVFLLLFEWAGADHAAAVGGGDVAGGQHAAAGGEAGEADQGAVGGAFVAGEEWVAGALDVFAGGLLGELFGFVDVDFPEVADVLGAGFVALFGGGVVVELECLAGGLHFGGEHYVGDAVAGSPHKRVAADDARQPDGRVGLLVGARPGVDVAVLVVLALPAEGAGGSPGFDYEVVRLLKAFPVVGRGRVVGDALSAGAADPAGDQPAARDHIYDGELLDEPEGVVPDGDDVAEQDDFGAGGDAG